MTTTPFATRVEYLDAVEKAQEAAAAYYQPDADGSIVLDDGTYDELVRRVVATETDNPNWKQTNTLTSVAAGTGSGDVRHSVPMLSLDNVFNDDELDEWAAGLARRLGKEPAGFTIEPKMDGLAIAARYIDGHLTQLITRGDGEAGKDVTYAASQIVGLPQRLARRVSIEVRGEVLLTDAQFAAANDARLAHGSKEFVNPRNGSAGALSGAKDRGYDIPMTFFGYQLVDPDGNLSPMPMTHSGAMLAIAELGIQTTGQSSAGMGQVTTVTAAHTWIDDLIARRPVLGFDIDGAVIKADSPIDRQNAGFSSRAPHWAIARKFPAVSALTTLVDVIWTLGRTGLITPSAVLEPVFVGGTTVTAATLHNPADVARKDLRIGDRVSVRRAGEVIPRVEAVAPGFRTGQEKVVEPPVMCPRCGADIDRSQERWRCTRGRACGAAESIAYAVARDAWDCEGIGEKVVRQLVETGLVTDVADLFALTRAQLLTLDRMGDLSVEKILAQITQAKSAPLARTITALGIRGTGRSLSRRLAKHFGSMGAFTAATFEELQHVDGVGVEKAALIREELTALADVIAKLEGAGVAMSDTGTADAGDAGDLPFAGKAVCVSGTVPGLSRTQAQEWVERLGGRAAGSVSKNTDLLVHGAGAGSKLAKAQALGVATMDADTFAQMVQAAS